MSSERLCRYTLALCLGVLLTWVTMSLPWRPGFGSRQVGISSEALAVGKNWKTSSYYFPLDAPHYQFHSWSNHVNGVTRIVASNPTPDEDDFANHLVEATLSFDGGPMEHISLDAFNRSSGSGLSLRVADDRHHHYSFVLTLRFPAGRKYSWVESRVFSTEPQKWDHRVDDLAKHHIAFDRISFTALQGSMYVKSLTADKAELRTSVGSIRGHFNVSKEALQLSAHIGLVTVD